MSEVPDPTVPKVRVRTRQNFPGQVHPALDKAAALQTEVANGVATDEPSELGTAADDYSVGYGRPPKHSRFQKGVSGNKKGRPKASKNARTIARNLLARKTPVTIDGKRQKITALEIAVLQQVKRATEKGDLKALQYVTNLAEGEAPSPSQLAANPSSSQPFTLEAQDLYDLAILAHHRREEMLARGIAPDVVDLVMTELGLVAKEPAS
jgi:hypothetical protein